MAPTDRMRAASLSTRRTPTTSNTKQKMHIYIHITGGTKKQQQRNNTNTNTNTNINHHGLNEGRRLKPPSVAEAFTKLLIIAYLFIYGP
jgi:hypothetical protein